MAWKEFPTLTSSALKKLRQEDYCEFKSILYYVARPISKKVKIIFRAIIISQALLETHEHPLGYLSILLTPFLKILPLCSSISQLFISLCLKCLWQPPTPKPCINSQKCPKACKREKMLIWIITSFTEFCLLDLTVACFQRQDFFLFFFFKYSPVWSFLRFIVQLTLDSWVSCLSFPTAWITDIYHHTQLLFFRSISLS